MKKTIKVVGAIIENDRGEILCALRSHTMILPGFWEFPGGKVDENETIYEAVVREVYEELKCHVEAMQVFVDHIHEYEAIVVNLITIKCRLIDGTPLSNEHAQMVWLKKPYLKSLVWAPADIPTIEKLMVEE